MSLIKKVDKNTILITFCFDCVCVINKKFNTQFLSFLKDLPAELKHFIKQRKKKITMILRVTASESSRVQF